VRVGFDLKIVVPRFGGELNWFGGELNGKGGVTRKRRLPSALVRSANVCRAVAIL
jgi:hypothetical protein